MFQPWIGSNFGKAGDVNSARLLILGESHHAQEYPIGHSDPEFTCDVFDNYWRGDWRPWMRTLDNVAATVAGRTKPELGRGGVNATWDDLAFYNYIPFIAASGPRQRPLAEHFAAGHKPFEKLLKTIRPKAIMVCGYDLWGHLVRDHDPNYVDNPWKPNNPFVSFANQRIPALRMIHPSTAFSPKAWTPLVVQLLAKGTAPEVR